MSKRIRAKRAHTLEPGCRYIRAGEEATIHDDHFDESNHEEINEDGSTYIPPAPEAAPVELRTDGPTLEEFVKAGYLAENYPPPGYAKREP